MLLERSVNTSHSLAVMGKLGSVPQSHSFERLIEEDVKYKVKQHALGGHKAALSTRKCKHCTAVYIPTSMRQKWCVKCAPNRTAQARLRRYGISEVEYQTMLDEQKGMCAICRTKLATCMDHSHITGKNRRPLCNGCNHVLAWVENAEWLKRALFYASSFSGAVSVVTH